MRYLVFLLVLLLPAASAQNFGFEEGMANWETFPATVKDYGADVSQDWSSEGNHSLLFGGSSGIPSHRDDSGGAVRHNSSIVKEGDEVCIDIHAQTGFDGPWRVYSSLSSVNFRDFIHSEDYTNTCITAQKGGSIDIVVRGTATSGRCSSCKAWVYIDNVHIYSCTNGIKDGEETDVDCGRRCAQCANGKGCATNSDCSSFFCDGAICKEAQNYSYHHNYNFEQGEQTFWIFEGKGVGGVGASVSPDWSSAIVARVISWSSLSMLRKTYSFISGYSSQSVSSFVPGKMAFGVAMAWASSSGRVDRKRANPCSSTALCIPLAF